MSDDGEKKLRKSNDSSQAVARSARNHQSQHTATDENGKAATSHDQQMKPSQYQSADASKTSVDCAQRVEQDEDRHSFLVPSKRVDNDDTQALQPIRGTLTEGTIKADQHVNHVAVQEDSNDDDDDDDRPGAFRVGGIGDTSVVEEEDRTIHSATLLLPSIPVETVDDNELAERYRNAARETIREKLEAEAVEATAVNLTHTDHVSGMERRKTWICVASIGTLLILAAAVVTGVMLSSRRNAGADDKPSRAPSLDSGEPDCDGCRNYNYLKTQILEQSIAVDEDVFDNPATPQYLALEWLVYTDPSIVESEGLPLEILLDRYALAVLYFSTNGTEWTINEGFLGERHACDWPGIACDSNESIFRVSFEYNNLVGTLRSELALIQSLEEIGFRGNGLSGTIPSDFGDLSRLEWLQLPLNNLSGSIPDSLSNLVNLEELYLYNNQLTGTIPEGLTKLPILEILVLSSNLLTGSIPDFNKQESMSFLGLDDNLHDGPIPQSLVDLVNLDGLSLAENSISGTIPTELGLKLTRLEFLFLSENALTGTISTNIGNLDFLEQISLSLNGLNGTIPTEVGNMQELETVYLYLNQLTGTIPSEVGRLTGLTSFFIDLNPITGTLPSTFSSLTNLEFFGLSFTDIAGDLDPVICSVSNHWIVQADCGGDDPKVNCTCCSHCCSPTACELKLDQVCNNLSADVQMNVLEEQAECGCPMDQSMVACNLGNCTTCNESNTTCGTTTKFELEIGQDGIPSRFQSDFQYTKGRNDAVISFEYSVLPIDCKVSVNGKECNSCYFGGCDDGFLGMSINCLNTYDEDGMDGPLIYNSCFPQDGGILDVFGWMDTGSFSGCPFAVPLTYFSDV